MARSGRKREAGEPCEGCRSLSLGYRSEPPELPSSWAPLGPEGLHRCGACGNAWRLRFDRREGCWEAERLDAEAEDFLRGRPSTRSVVEAAHRGGWVGERVFEEVAGGGHDFGELARGLVKRLAAPGLGDRDATRLVAVLCSAAYGRSGQALWKAIRAKRTRPVALDLAPLLARLEREPPEPLVESARQLSEAVLGLDHGRAVSLIDPPGGQRDRLHAALGHRPR